MQKVTGVPDSSLTRGVATGGGGGQHEPPALQNWGADLPPKLLDVEYRYCIISKIFYHALKPIKTNTFFIFSFGTCNEVAVYVVTL